MSDFLVGSVAPCRDIDSIETPRVLLKDHNKKSPAAVGTRHRYESML